jgi:hypothetical protein
LVKQYPPVRGLVKNVFFLSHNHKESGGEDSTSRYNAYEVSIALENMASDQFVVCQVDMIKDLVLYLLRYGIATQSIVEANQDCLAKAVIHKKVTLSYYVLISDNYPKFAMR